MSNSGIAAHETMRLWVIAYAFVGNQLPWALLSFIGHWRGQAVRIAQDDSEQRSLFPYVSLLYTKTLLYISPSNF